MLVAMLQRRFSRLKLQLGRDSYMLITQCVLDHKRMPEMHAVRHATVSTAPHMTHKRMH
jgi:hypothetical protein